MEKECHCEHVRCEHACRRPEQYGCRSQGRVPATDDTAMAMPVFRIFEHGTYSNPRVADTFIVLPCRAYFASRVLSTPGTVEDKFVELRSHAVRHGGVPVPFRLLVRQ